jgi:hypothetical protein
MCNFKNTFFCSGIWSLHHEADELEHGIDDFGFEMKTWRGLFVIKQDLNYKGKYLLIILKQEMPNLLELGIILERQRLNKANINRFKWK